MDLSQKSMKELRALAKKHCPHAEVILDRHGTVGVRESSLPKGCSYKIREGAFSKTGWTRLAKFEDDDEAAEAAEEAAEEARKDTARPVASDDEMDGEEYEECRAPVPACPAKRPRSLSPTNSRAGGSVYGGGSCAMSPFRSEAAEPVPPAAASDAGSADRANSTVRPEEEATPPRMPSPTKEAGEEYSLTKTSSLLRSTAPDKILQACRRLQDMASTRMTARQLWENPFRQRDVGHRCDLILKAANRCSGIDDDRVQKPAGFMSELAEQLAGEADRVTHTVDLFTTVRKNPLAMTEATLQNEFLKVVKRFDNRLKSTVFAAIGNGAITKLAAESECGKEALQTLRFCEFQTTRGTSDVGLHLGMLLESKNVAQSTQTHLVMQFIEMMMKRTKRDYVATYAELLKQGAVPDLKNTIFGAEPLSLDGWSQQALADLSFATLTFYTIQADLVLPPRIPIRFRLVSFNHCPCFGTPLCMYRPPCGSGPIAPVTRRDSVKHACRAKYLQGTGFCASGGFPTKPEAGDKVTSTLATAAAQALEWKGKVSVRLRTSSQTYKKVSCGDNDIARWAWEAFEKLRSSRKEKGVLYKELESLWDKLRREVPAVDEEDAHLVFAAELFEHGHDVDVSSMAQKFSECPDCQKDPTLAEPLKWLKM